MAKFCKNCGAELSEGSVFCDECGTKAGNSSPPKSNDLFRLYNIDMMDGEEVIRHSQIHVGCLYLPLIILGLGLFFGFIGMISILSDSYYYGSASFFFIIIGYLNIFTIVGAIWFIIRYIGYKTNDLILTNKRVFGKCGLISTTQMQAPLNKIDSVSFSNGPVGKLIGYGTVRIATTSSVFKFRFIREGQSLYNDIFNQLEISEVENRNENAKAIVDAMEEKLS
jgi:uncharacterized membrane protein YdbT with pleckstrin-like domain